MRELRLTLLNERRGSLQIPCRTNVGYPLPPAGIGYAIIVVLLLVNTYYNVLIAYALFYLFASITSELPWGKCDNKWNTEYCIATKYGELIALRNGALKSWCLHLS